jgi:hypothetical protein
VWAPPIRNASAKSPFPARACAAITGNPPLSHPVASPCCMSLLHQSMRRLPLAVVAPPLMPRVEGSATSRVVPPARVRRLACRLASLLTPFSPAVSCAPFHHEAASSLHPLSSATQTTAPRQNLLCVASHGTRCHGLPHCALPPRSQPCAEPLYWSLSMCAPIKGLHRLTFCPRHRPVVHSVSVATLP